MLQALVNVFRIRELRNKLLFTFAMLAVYRIGFWIPLPGVDQEQMKEFFQLQAAEGGAISKVMQFVAVFSGGNLGKSTIFGQGIMPYISASIIFQLMASALPALKKLQEEGPTGRQKIMEWTRYATIGLCIVQGFFWLKYISVSGLVYPQWVSNPLWWVMSIAALTAGTVFLMWLGEQIDRHGIGNGVSLIITAGILTELPNAVMLVVQTSVLAEMKAVQFLFGPPGQGFEPAIGWLGILSLLGGFVLVVAGSVLMTVAQRRIPVQQAKHTRGRRVYGGQKSFLPLRVNHSGVMPVIFASSLMIFPSVIFAALASSLQQANQEGWMRQTALWMQDNFSMGMVPYILCEIVLIYFFSYFWITIQFNPEDMAKQLREHGSFIPGLRPALRTAEYLETVMEPITFVGAAFLAVISILPTVVNQSMGIDFRVTQFLGGTGLLIVVSVCLDFIQRVEANLLMRNYAGFLGGGDDGKGPRMRGPRG